MNSYRRLLLLTGLVSLMLTGCLSGGGNSISGDGSSLRVANLVAGVPTVDVTLDDKAVLTAAPFETVTNYTQVNAGNHRIRASIDGGASFPVDIASFFAPTDNFTFIAFGPPANIGGLVLNDKFTDPGNGNLAFQVVNLAPLAGAIDVYLTAQGADLSAATPTASSVGYGASTTYANIPLMNYEVRITPAGAKTVLFDSGARDFGGSSAQQAVVYSRGSSKLLSLALLKGDNNGASVIIDNAQSALKIVNASSIASPLNVAVDGVQIAAGIAPVSVSDYLVVPAGNHTVTVEAAGTPGATLLAINPTLAPGKDASIVLTGSMGALSATITADVNLPSSNAAAKVRFVNASQNPAAFDVYANANKLASNLQTGNASAYVTVDAPATGASYEFDFDIAGTTTPALALPGISLSAGHVYTVYVIGPAGALQGVVSQDL